MADVTTQLAKFLNYVTGAPSMLGMGVLFTSTQVIQNVGTGATDLITYTLPANALNANGQTIKVTASFTVTNNGDTKTAAVLFGATTVQTLSGAAASGVFIIEAWITRTGATTQTAFAKCALEGSSIHTTVTSPTETLSGSIVIKMQGTSGTGSNDIASQYMKVEWYGANP